MSTGISQLISGAAATSDAPVAQDVSQKGTTKQEILAPVDSCPISSSAAVSTTSSSSGSPSVSAATAVISSRIPPQTTPVTTQTATAAVNPSTVAPPLQQTLPPVSTLVSASLRPIAPAMTIPSTATAFPRSSLSNNVKPNNVCSSPTSQKPRIAPIPVQPRPPVRPMQHQPQSTQFQQQVVHQHTHQHQTAHNHQHSVPVLHQHAIHSHSHTTAQAVATPPPQPVTPIQQIHVTNQQHATHPTTQVQLQLSQSAAAIQQLHVPTQQQQAAQQVAPLQLQAPQPSTPVHIQAAPTATPVQIQAPFPAGTSQLQASQSSTHIQQIQTTQPAAQVQIQATQPATPVIQQTTQPAAPVIQQASQPATPVQQIHVNNPPPQQQAQPTTSVHQIHVTTQQQSPTPQYTTLKPVPLPRSIAPAPTATPVSVQQVVGTHHTNTYSHSYIPSMFSAGSQPATLHLTQSATYETPKSTPSVTESGGMVGHVCHCSKAKVGTCEPLAQAVTVNAGNTTTVSSSATTASIKPQIQPRVVSQPVAPVLPSVNAAVTSPYMSPVFSSSAQPPMMVNMMSMPQQPAAAFMGHSGILLHPMMPVQSFVTASQPPQQPQTHVSAASTLQHHHHPPTPTTTSFQTSSSSNHQHQHNSGNNVTSANNSINTPNNGQGLPNASHRPVMPKPPVNSPLKAGSRPLAPAPTRILDPPSRPMSSPTKMRAIMPSTSGASSSSCSSSHPLSSGSTSSGGLFGLKRGDAGRVLNFLSVKKKQALALINKTSTTASSLSAIHSGAQPPVIAPSSGQSAVPPVSHVGHTGPPILAGIPMKRKRGRPPKNRPPMMFSNFSSPSSTSTPRQQASTSAVAPQAASNASSNLSSNSMSNVSFNTASTVSSNSASNVMSNSISNLSSNPVFNPSPSPASNASSNPPSNTSYNPPSNSASGTATPVGQVVGSPRMPVLTASPAVSSSTPTIQSATVSPMPSTVPSPVPAVVKEEDEKEMSLTPLSIVTAGREDEEEASEGADSPSPMPSPVAPTGVGMKRKKTGIVRPEPRNILTHIIDGQVIYESDKPFPVKHAMDVILDTFGPPAKMVKLQNDSESPIHEETTVSATAFLRCEFCGEMKPSAEFKASRRFCSVSCARKSSVACKVSKKQNSKIEAVASVEPISAPSNPPKPTSIPSSVPSSTPSSIPHTVVSSAPSNASITPVAPVSTSTTTIITAAPSPAPSIPSSKPLPVTSSTPLPVSSKSFVCPTSISAAPSFSVAALPLPSTTPASLPASSYTTSITVTAPVLKVEAKRPNPTPPFSRPPPTSITPSAVVKSSIPQSTPLSAAPPRPKVQCPKAQLPSALVLSDVADATVLSARLGPMLNWSVEHVFDFVRSTAGCSAYAEAFRSNEIDGEALLLLKEEHLMQAPISMKLGPALKLSARIEEHRV